MAFAPLYQDTEMLKMLHQQQRVNLANERDYTLENRESNRYL